jgi:prophage regulatory protein
MISSTLTKGTPFVRAESVMAFRPRPFDICLDVRAVQQRVTFSLQHITRLERAGLFPKRIHLGPNRVGWQLSEILCWMQLKADTRVVKPMSPKIIVEPGDRFIRKKECRSLVLYTPDYLRKLELQGRFPGRIWIGANRVAWLEREVLDWRDTRCKQEASGDA